MANAFLGLPLVDDERGRVEFEMSGRDALSLLSSRNGFPLTSIEFARALDRDDPVSDLKSRFLLPKKDGKEVVYFVGNSLGPQPVDCLKFLERELASWSSRGVNGHFEGDRPWLHYDDFLTEEQARIVGALPSEVAVMNSLTVNLHLLLVRFYRPEGLRRKILVEARTFPSDFYAIQSQIRLRGLDPDECIVEVAPRVGEFCLRSEDVLAMIAQLGDQLAGVAFSGIHFYTGQLFDIPAITEAAHAVGAWAVWDLAHAAGNVDLNLHDWKVDGACWCSYKFLNSGPGGVAGFFIHESHFNKGTSVDRLSGWWSHAVSSRFEMDNVYEPTIGANEFRLSNVPILTSAALLCSLDIFKATSMRILRAKSILQTSLLEALLEELNGEVGPEFRFQIITPNTMRGAQLSLLFASDEKAKLIHKELEANGVVVDYRRPGLVRASPAPLYCSFADVVTLRDHLRASIHTLSTPRSCP